MAKIVFLSDYGFQGSGYLQIATSLCKGLAERGHEIKCIGLMYRGENHDFPFTIIPARDFRDVEAEINNLNILWPFDVLVCAMDIPIQEMILKNTRKLGIKQIVITPLESDPLIFSWANLLSNAEKVFFISQHATDEAHKAGLDDAEHILIGLDTVSWRLPLDGERQQIRKTFNIPEDVFVVLTVADNQERKNLSKSFEIVGKLKQSGVNLRYILVTREHQQVGWKLRDLAMTYGISSELMIFERGLAFIDLWMLYAMSDVFLLTSKAEGLGMPVLEAMASGLPVAVNNAGAMPELVGYNERGWLIDWDYIHVDPWGNSNRYMANLESGVKALHEVVGDRAEANRRAKLAREYVESRTWDTSVLQLERAIEVLRNDKQQEPTQGQIETVPS